MNHSAVGHTHGPRAEHGGDALLCPTAETAAGRGQTMAGLEGLCCRKGSADEAVWPRTGRKTETMFGLGRPPNGSNGRRSRGTNAGYCHGGTDIDNASDSDS